jgi:predicted ATPase
LHLGSANEIYKNNISRYRKLDNIKITLLDVTIFMGENNAGKSTVLEGIRGAVFESGARNTSRYFSKVSRENTSVRIFFKIEEEDVISILQSLSLSFSEEKLGYALEGVLMLMKDLSIHYEW